MAIYHLSVKAISRSAGRSATASAAYRAGEMIIDERTGACFDYSRKAGVQSTTIVLPDGAPDWASDRAKLWNAAEQKETRKNSTVAREFEIALPAELSAEERARLAVDFAREIVLKHGCAADVAIHAPNPLGDQSNHHAHILLSTRRLSADGFTQKTRELDDKATGSQLVIEWRERFAVLQNSRLKESGINAQVDHRSLKDQDIDRAPTRHLGPTATDFERRQGEPSRRRLDHEAEAIERLVRAKAIGELERQSREINQSIIDLTTDLAAARVEREREKEREKEQLRKQAAMGVDTFRQSYAQHKAEQQRQNIEQQKQQQAELDRQQAMQALAAHRIEVERQQQMEIEQNQRRRDGPDW